MIKQDLINYDDLAGFDQKKMGKIKAMSMFWFERFKKTLLPKINPGQTSKDQFFNINFLTINETIF